MGVQTLIVHEVILKRKIPLDELCAGLEKAGVLEVMQKHPKEMKPFFVSETSSTLDVNKLVAQFSNIHTPQEDENEERARGYLLQSVQKLFAGKTCIKKHMVLSSIWNTFLEVKCSFKLKFNESRKQIISS